MNIKSEVNNCDSEKLNPPCVNANFDPQRELLNKWKAMKEETKHKSKSANAKKPFTPYATVHSVIHNKCKTPSSSKKSDSSTIPPASSSSHKKSTSSKISTSRTCTKNSTNKTKVNTKAKSFNYNDKNINSLNVKRKLSFGNEGSSQFYEDKSLMANEVVEKDNFEQNGKNGNIGVENSCISNENDGTPDNANLKSSSAVEMSQILRDVPKVYVDEVERHLIAYELYLREICGNTPKFVEKSTLNTIDWFKKLSFDVLIQLLSYLISKKSQLILKYLNPIEKNFYLIGTIEFDGLKVIHERILDVITSNFTGEEAKLFYNMLDYYVYRAKFEERFGFYDKVILCYECAIRRCQCQKNIKEFKSFNSRMNNLIKGNTISNDLILKLNTLNFNSENPPITDRIDSEKNPPITDKIDSEKNPPITDRIDSEKNPPITDRIDSEKNPPITDRINSKNPPITDTIGNYSRSVHLEEKGREMEAVRWRSDMEEGYGMRGINSGYRRIESLNEKITGLSLEKKVNECVGEVGRDDGRVWNEEVGCENAFGCKIIDEYGSEKSVGIDDLVESFERMGVESCKDVAFGGQKGLDRKTICSPLPKLLYTRPLGAPRRVITYERDLDGDGAKLASTSEDSSVTILEITNKCVVTPMRRSLRINPYLKESINPEELLERAGWNYKPNNSLNPNLNSKTKNFEKDCLSFEPLMVSREQALKELEKLNKYQTPSKLGPAQKIKIDKDSIELSDMVEHSNNSESTITLESEGQSASFSHETKLLGLSCDDPNCNSSLPLETIEEQLEINSNQIKNNYNEEKISWTNTEGGDDGGYLTSFGRNCTEDDTGTSIMPPVSDTKASKGISESKSFRIAAYSGTYGTVYVTPKRSTDGCDGKANSILRRSRRIASNQKN